MTQGIENCMCCEGDMTLRMKSLNNKKSPADKTGHDNKQKT